MEEIEIIPNNQSITAVIIDSKVDHENMMLVPLMRLEKRKLDYLFVNGIPFQRKDFEFKNGNFNNSGAMNTLVHAYCFRNVGELNKYINNLELMIKELSQD